MPNMRRASENSDGNVNGPGTSDFGYEEFSGKDGKTCPTCKGTGRISKHQEEELVALIPYHDSRLKPRRTKLYVALAILCCLVVMGLVLFFILPRSVELQEGRVTNYTVKIDKNQSSTVIVINNQFNITNTNFFHVEVTKIVVETFFDQVQVGQGALKPAPIMVPPRTENFLVNVTVKMEFNSGNQLDFMSDLCTNEKRRVHDIVIKIQATQTSKYLQHTEQNMLSTYRYIDCGPDHHT